MSKELEIVTTAKELGGTLSHDSKEIILITMYYIRFQHVRVSDGGRLATFRQTAGTLL
jgi:hypothetical protein